MGKKAVLINQANWDNEVLSSDTPVLVDFWAEWCPPCKMLDPIVDELAEEYDGRLRVVKIDTDESPDVAFNNGVMGMPTLILFKDGEAVTQIRGFKSKDKIVSELISHI